MILTPELDFCFWVFITLSSSETGTPRKSSPEKKLFGLDALWEGTAALGGAHVLGKRVLPSKGSAIL
jgi:hypothetical protein